VVPRSTRLGRCESYLDSAGGSVGDGGWPIDDFLALVVTQDELDTPTRQIDGRPAAFERFGDRFAVALNDSCVSHE
jgi:hypothetical protein